MFGKRLRELREEKGLSQEELGKILNKSKNNISQYETGKREPDLDTLNRISELFNVSLDYLLGKSDFKQGRIITLNELKTFLPEEKAEDLIKKHNLQITVDDKDLPEHIKEEIIKFLKTKGYLD